jgi:catechol 2,3-dioxygenase-like lactoylglutathione lyase family enzyme
VLSTELEHCLNEAFQQARKGRHVNLKVEHMLLALLDTPKVCEILRACRCDIIELTKELEQHLDQSMPRRDEAEGGQAPPILDAEPSLEPTVALQRVLQRAVFHVQSGGRKEVRVADVLVAIFSEKHSHAVSLLNRKKVTRLDVINYISHGLEPPSATKIGSIVIHTPQFQRTVQFWQAALGYVPREPAKADWAVLCDPTGRGPNLAFQGRDRRPRSRSWVHLDLYASGQEAEVERLLKLGARRYPWRYAPGSDFVVLEDPGGNLFCVVAKPGDH